MKKFLTGYFITCFVFFLNAQGDHQKDSLFQLGINYLEKSEIFYPSNFDSCIYYTKLAQPYFEKTEAWSYFVNCINGLSTLYYQIGDFQKYIKHSQEALQQAEEHLGKKSKPYGFALNNLGTFYLQKGDYQGAIQLYKKSLSIQENYDSLSQFVVITLSTTYKNLGNAFFEKKDYAESLRYYKKALAIKESSNDPFSPFTANNYYDIGNCYQWMNQADSAFYYFQKCLDVLEHLPPGDFMEKIAINANFGISGLLFHQKAPEQFLSIIQKIERLQEKQKRYRIAQRQELLGQYYLLTKHPTKAIEHFEEAIQHFFQETNRSIFKHQDLASFHRQIAEAHLLKQAPEQALAAYQKALQSLAYRFSETDPSQNPSSDDLISKASAVEILDGKAQTLIQLAAKQKTYRQIAHQCYQLAKKLIRELRNDYLATGSKHLLAAQVLPVYEHAIENALQLYEQSQDQQYLADAFDSAESNKALLLLESLNENLARKEGEIPDSLLQMERQLTIDLAFYNKKIQEEKQKGEKGNTAKITQWESNQFELQKKHQELIEELEKNFPKYISQKYDNKAIDLPALQAALPAKSILLEYFVGNEKAYLFQVKPQGLAVRRFQMGAEQLEALQVFEQLAKTPPRSQSAQADFQQFTQAGWELYQLLLAPELESNSQVQSLVLIPDPSLALLPFELLLQQQQSDDQIDYGPGILPYLLNDYAISYDYSASIYHKNMLAEVIPAAKRFAGFAPSFNDAIAMRNRSCLNERMYSLKCSEQEVNAVQQLLGGEVHIGTQASKPFFQKEAAKYQILHLATHACINEENPMLNRIYFTDDYLSNYELSTLQLNADLAVLSACNTGAGKLIKGEGVMSLARSFVQAGCPSTVMSLWPINDCSTASIMSLFYQELEAGRNKNEALRQAKLTYLSTANKEERHPYYWAAFVQFGKIHPIPVSRFFSFPLLFVGLGILAFLAFALIRTK